MSFIIKSAKLTGNPNELGWTQACEFKPGEEGKLKTRDELFAVISTSLASGGIESITAGREVLARLHEEYYGKVDGAPFDVLRSSVNRVLKEFADREAIEIAAAVICEDKVYLSVGGGARAFLFRGGLLATLTKSQKGEVVAASGKISLGDLLIVGTNTFFEYFPNGVLKGALGSADPREISELLTPRIQSSQSGEKIGALLIKFEEGEAFTGNFVPEPLAVFQERSGVTEPRNMPALKGSANLILYKKVGSIVTALGALRGRKLYINRSSEAEGDAYPKRRQVSVAVGVVLLVALGISVFFGIKQRRALDIKARYQGVLTSARHQLEEAQDLHSLDSERSRELFALARDQVLGLSDEKIDDPAIDDLKREISNSEKNILGEYKVNPQLFVDLSLQSSGFKGDFIRASDEKIYVLDKAGKKVIGISISTKRSQIVAGPNDISTADDFAVYVDRVFVLNSQGVTEVGENEPVINWDWTGTILPYIYAGNVYVLERETSAIYRYLVTESGYGSKNVWLTDNSQVNLSNASAWVIDGSIWVLTSDGQIIRFSLGNLINFSISGVFPKVSTPAAIYTNEGLESLYILDPDEARVLVIGKDGKYKAQYLSEQIKDADGLVVSEKEKKIILLAGEKLLSFDLEHQ